VSSDELIKPQPRSIPNDDVAIWDLVIEDMKARDRFGTAKHGTRLQLNNGRDHLIDAYQEALDLCVYLRQEIERRRRNERNQHHEGNGPVHP